MTQRVFASKIIVAVALLSSMAWVTSAAAAPPPPMTVELHQPSGAPLSYFNLSAHPGQRATAGSLEVRNRTGKRITVLLDPIDAQTASTLGSAYSVRGLSRHGPARWTRLAKRRVVIRPRGRTNVAVNVLPPGGAGPGDYLSGIGVQAVEKRSEAKVRSNVAISSIQRYAVGLEVNLPGPRHPLIRLTGARIKRDPAGVAFYISGRNAGNVILQNVRGWALITQGDRQVERIPIGPGTFVTGTSIAYPIPTPDERPHQGNGYRVRALMRYQGGVARLDTLVRFGHAAAVRQQAFGGPKASSEGGSFPWWLAASVGLAILNILIAIYLWRQRRRLGARSPQRTLEEALAGARNSGVPLSVIMVAVGGGDASRRVASVVRSRLRPTDRLCRLDDRGFLVVAPDTDAEAAGVLAADLQRHIDRDQGGSNGVRTEVHAADEQATAAELLDRVIGTNGGAQAPIPTSY
jgi:hypothetical protein